MIPLAIMFMLVILSQMGMGTSEDFGEGSMSVTGGSDTGFLYDSAGVSKLNSTTLEPVNASETITIVREEYTGVATFINTTGLLPTHYVLYFDSGAAYPAMYHELAMPSAAAGGGSEFQVSIDGSFAFIAVVTALVIFVTIIGFQFFGTGESDASIFVIILFTGLMAFWAILSVGALTLITSIPDYGAIFYTILTLVYSVGCFESISNGGSE